MYVYIGPKMLSSKLTLMLITFMMVQVGDAGVKYGLCQSACAAGVVACYSSAGLVFGTVTAGVGAPAAAIACNKAFGLCSAKCAVVFLPGGVMDTIWENLARFFGTLNPFRAF